MRLFALLALAPGFQAVLGSPSPAVVERQENSACNPYTDWGHTQGTQSYHCYNFAGWFESPDYHCVSYKSADFCNGKAYCDASKPCTGNQICRYGICLTKVNAKQCQKTCSNVS